MKLSGKTTVLTAGTAVVLGTENINCAIAIKASVTNSGVMYVGNDGTNDVDFSTGFPLSATQVVVLSYVGDLETIYVDAQYDGESVTWIKLDV